MRPAIYLLVGVALSTLTSCARYEADPAVDPYTCAPSPNAVSRAPLVDEPTGLPPGHLAVRVVLAELTSRPIARAFVVLRELEAADGASLALQTDSAGTAVFAGLSAGPHELRVRFIGLGRRVDTLELRDGRSTSVAAPMEIPRQHVGGCGITLLRRKSWWKFW